MDNVTLGIITTLMLVGIIFVSYYYHINTHTTLADILSSERKNITEKYNAECYSYANEKKAIKEFEQTNKPIFNDGNKFDKWMVIKSHVTKDAGKWCYEYCLLNTESLKHRRLLEAELILLSNSI